MKTASGFVQSAPREDTNKYCTSLLLTSFSIIIIITLNIIIIELVLKYGAPFVPKVNNVHTL